MAVIGRWSDIKRIFKYRASHNEVGCIILYKVACLQRLSYDTTAIHRLNFITRNTNNMIKNKPNELRVPQSSSEVSAMDSLTEEGQLKRIW